MLDGIYHVRFSSQSDFGEGIAVFNNGSVNGGDHGYLYLGNIASKNKEVSGKLLIKRWKTSVNSVFGNLQQFELTVAGVEVNDRSFQADGNIVGQQGMKIKILGELLSELA